ncbi:14639_t:CDS:2, partial [Dentiscutata heterogama]
EKQSLASKNYKLTNFSNSAVGDHLDIMFTIKIGENHLELLYVESGDYMKIYELQQKDNLYFYFPLTEACISLENTS